MIENMSGGLYDFNVYKSLTPPPPPFFCFLEWLNFFLILKYIFLNLDIICMQEGSVP